jgi:hypothetical protein
MSDMPNPGAMPASVRAWLDYELAYAAYWAGRSATDPGEYVSSPSVDDLCAALPLAADQLERVKILGELRSELYNGEDLIIGELYLAAQEFPERMDHMYDYIHAASSARKELGPDVIEWLRELGEFGEGVDMDTAQVMVHALHMDEAWQELTADWVDVPALEQRTVWHDGRWRRRQAELVPLHRAEQETVRQGHATPEQLEEWRTQRWLWPQPVKTDSEGPWVVTETWRALLHVKGLNDDELEVQRRNAQDRANRRAARLRELEDRADTLREWREEEDQRVRMLNGEWRARHGEPMRRMSTEQVQAALELNRAEQAQ